MCEKRCISCAKFVDKEELEETVAVITKTLFGKKRLTFKETGKKRIIGFMECSAGNKKGLIDGNQECLVEEEFVPLV